MDPIFIYNNKLIFDENQSFILNFSNGDVLKGVNFSKENDYYIMSMPCFIEASNDIEIIFDNKTYQSEINKISRSKAVNLYNFYDHLLKRKRFAIVYSPYKDFVENGITYEKKTKNKSNVIGGYTIKIMRKNNKDFIQKEIYFNKSKLVSKIKRKNDDKNMIFFKIYPFKLEITESYTAKFSDATDKRNSYNFI